MADGIQEMYEHQEMKGYGGYEYVVRGAEVSCSYGSKTCVLNLKDDHGVHTSDGRPLITENDSTTDNIKALECVIKTGVSLVNVTINLESGGLLTIQT